MKKAIIILGHGSKADDALVTLKKYGEMVKAAGQYDLVEIASLQFNEPDLPSALNTVINQKANKVVIVPLFLFNGIHVQEDIPAVLAKEQAKNPGVEIVLAESLGLDNRIVDIVLERITEVS